MQVIFTNRNIIITRYVDISIFNLRWISYTTTTEAFQEKIIFVNLYHRIWFSQNSVRSLNKSKHMMCTSRMFRWMFCWNRIHRFRSFPFQKWNTVKFVSINKQVNHYDSGKRTEISRMRLKEKKGFKHRNIRFRLIIK